MKEIRYSIMTPELLSDIMAEVREVLDNPVGNILHFNCSSNFIQQLGRVMMTDLRFHMDTVPGEVRADNYGTFRFQGNRIVLTESLIQNEGRAIIVSYGRTVMEIIQQES
jgi:hypothetical protein